MTTQQIILLAVFLAVITSAVIYTTRLRSKQATLDRYGREPSSKEEGIAVATTTGTRAEADFRAAGTIPKDTDPKSGLKP